MRGSIIAEQLPFDTSCSGSLTSTAPEKYMRTTLYSF